MPINNTQGLDALRALSEGGSAGLDAYKQAQGNEQASRTTALQNALGGQDVAAAAAKAQAQYSPQVPTSGMGVGDLGAAANSYLSNAANKLSNQNYQDQQNLTLQAESLRRQQVSDKDRMLMLQGAADDQATQQRTAAETAAGQQTGAVTGLGGAEQQRGDLMRALYGADQALAGARAGASNAPGLAATPEFAQIQAKEQAARDALTQYDQGAQGRFAQAMATEGAGRGTQGLQDAYNNATATGDFHQYNDLVKYLGGEAQQVAGANQAQANREIDMGGQKRLRDLAPQFGYNPEVAKGMFREGEGNDLAIAGNKGKQDAYVENAPTAADRKAQDTQVADSLGFDSPTDFTRLRSKTGMGTDDIVGAMQSPHWGKIQEIANGVATGEIENGFEGFSDTVKNYVNSLTGEDGKQMSQKDRAALIELANTYFKPGTTAAAGKGEAQ